MARSAPRSLLLAFLVTATACADRNPTGLQESPPTAAPPPVQAALECRMDVRAQTLTCRSASPEAAPGVSRLIVGGQGTNVRLASSGTIYDAASGILRSTVTVQNLRAEALGTTDGAFPSPEGVRVFFHAGPTVTGGSGVVTVGNADGVAAFTSGAQEYFQYPGLLAPGSVSEAKEWRFGVPASVTAFVFSVFVAAPVRGATLPPPAIVFLAGTGATDTVDATRDSVLRVGVRGRDGKAAVNALVQVSGVGLPYPSFAPEVRVAPALGGGFGFSQYEFTDAQGIVEFRVKMGPRAKPGRVAVSVPYLGLADTARYTILPGSASEVLSLPEDTTVTIGSRAPLRLVVLDRHGNPRADPVTLSVSAGPGVVAGGELVAGASIGRITAVAAAGAARDTSYVRVVPSGTVAVAVAANNTGQAAALYTLSLDASSIQQVKTSIVGAGYFGQMAVGWLGPTKLVYHDNNWDHTKQLYVLDLATGADTRFLPPADRMDMEQLPRASRDGKWVYFSGGTFWNYYLYRARADGTERERVPTPYAGNEWSADLSPDGTRIAFVRDGWVHVMDLATRTVRPLDRVGGSPRWSPDGSRIACVARPSIDESERLMLVNPDGSGARTLTATPIYGDIDWSPDGKYIVGATFDNQLAIVEVATGAEVVVHYPGIGGTMLSPAWRP